MILLILRITSIVKDIVFYKVSEIVPSFDSGFNVLLGAVPNNKKELKYS